MGSEMCIRDRGWEVDFPESRVESVAEPDEITPVTAVVDRGEPVTVEPQPAHDERLEGMRVLLRSLGRVQSAIIESSLEVLSAYLKGRLHSGGSGS